MSGNMSKWTPSAELLVQEFDGTTSTVGGKLFDQERKPEPHSATRVGEAKIVGSLRWASCKPRN